MKTLFRTLTALICLAISGFAPAEQLDSRLLPSLGDVRYHELKSGLLGRSFHIFVDLPDDYATGADSYPTVYLLDGGAMFPMLAAYHHYLRFGEEVPAAILVGISYGGSTFEEGNLRSTDFTAPSEERAFWGGAETFQQVLQKELIPLIEGAYRSDASRRVVFGQSLGGQFVLFNALTRPDLFFGHIASNPALHRNLPFFLQWHGQIPLPEDSSRIFVSSGENDDERFRAPALEWMEFWQKASEKPWQLETRTLHGQSHFSAAPAAFRQGLSWLFPARD